MEPPVAFDADAVRDEKVKVLRAIPPCTRDQVPQHVVRAQYGAGAGRRQAGARLSAGRGGRARTR